MAVDADVILKSFGSKLDVDAVIFRKTSYRYAVKNQANIA